VRPKLKQRLLITTKEIEAAAAIHTERIKKAENKLLTAG
jgi:hypothetical protein